jgi:hypothetical protein
MRARLAALCLVLGCGPLMAQTAAPWRDDYATRVKLLAVIETLNADLLASRSATATLEKWCGDHHMAPAAKIVARRADGDDRAASAETRKNLSVGPEEPLRFRRVQLVCGDHVMSEAENWYVPARLTSEMNQSLSQSDTPFGKVVGPLQPSRRTIDAKLRWSPLPPGWEMRESPASEPGKAQDLAVPHALLEHRALVVSRDNQPIAEVDEVYTSEVLNWPRGKSE